MVCTVVYEGLTTFFEKLQKALIIPTIRFFNKIMKKKLTQKKHFVKIQNVFFWC